MSGFFITFEGGEGAGKSTILDRLYDEFKEQGIPLLKTREPGGVAVSEKIRQLLLDCRQGVAIGENAELLLFLSARVQHLEELIFPSLLEGKLVFCDRFHDSSIAYQGNARGLGMDYVEKLCLLSCHNRWPDLTLWFDVDPSEGLVRARKAEKDFSKAEEMDRIESEALRFHENVQAGYRHLAEKYPERIVVIDANKSLEEVYVQSRTAIMALLEHV